MPFPVLYPFHSNVPLIPQTTAIKAMAPNETTATATARARVALLDDDAGLRQQLSQLFNGTPGFCCVGDYGSLAEALAGLRQTPADVLLLDLEMPGVDGIQALPHVQKAFQGMITLVLTMFHDDEKLFGALKAGASGYLLKSDTPQHLCASIQLALGGGAPMSASIARRVVQSFSRGIHSPETPALSERESQVLSKLRDGLSYKEAAEALDMRIDTLRSHVKGIYSKLQVRSLVQAVKRTTTRSH